MNQKFSEQILLYDGLCNFCDDTVQFILERDRTGTLTFAPLQGDFASGLMSRHPELAAIDSLMLVRRSANGDEVVLVRSAAALAIAHYLGGVWRIAGLLARVLPTSMRDAAYSAFARRRIRWFGRREACRIASPAERARFID